MIPIRRIGFASFDSGDIEKSVDYYTNVLGLSLLDRVGGTAWLACPGDALSVVLNASQRPAGEAAHCGQIGLQIGPQDDLAEVEHHLRGLGLSPERVSDVGPGVAAQVRVTDPAGVRVCVHNALPPVPRAATCGVVPRKLGHTAFFAPDVQKTVEFYQTALGFRVSDWIGDFFVFLRCGPDHHTVNFLHGPVRRMHHIAFELNDWTHVKHACDELDRHDLHLSWGPGRHGPGHNIYTYHTNPDGIMVELFTELDQMSDESLGWFDPRPWHKDRPQRPKVWPPGTPTTNFWGVARPVGINEQRETNAPR